ncbi:MAG: hypothetical protein LCI00_17665 [Chloroflexi bacterium]|nr:hypothetical protein [Chloroflexota bacterium]MCC6896743.1 hypothetical protein [Anaerolineae bacterium]
MAKQLPPSGAALRLVDVYGRAASILREQRPDIEVVYSPKKESNWRIAPDSVDAVAAFNAEPSAELLKSALRALRPGGRLIIMNAHLDPSETYVKTLEGANFTRILVEVGAECPLPTGALIRGEKPHTESRTVDRVKQVAAQDAPPRTSRYVQLLIHQNPHKPIWRMTPEDKITWQAVAVAGEGETVLLTFSSLPKAVEFMQFAVMEGYITNVNKIAKFKWDVVKDWPFPTILNPSDEIFATQAVIMVAIDHATAEAPDE